MTQPGIPMLGDPGTVVAGADELASMASTLLRLAATLEAIADDDITEGDSIDAIRERTTSAAGKARAVAPRYSETASALHEYAVSLGDAQRDLATAEAAYATASGDVARLAHREWALQREIDALDRADPARADLERDLVILQASLEDERAAIGTSLAAIDAAWQRFQEAGTRAADRIHPALDTMNDGVLDHLGSFWGDVVGFLSVVGDWIARILDTLLTSLLLLVLVVVAAIVILVVVLAFLPQLLALYASGAVSWELLFESLVGIALIVVPIVAPIVKVLLVREALTPTPTVRQVEPYGGQLVDRGTEDDGTPKTEYEYLFDNNGTLDRDGLDASTIVEIVQVFNDDGSPRLDEHGNPVWRVTLPSTQDWQIGLSGGFGDTGAVNDLGSNLALIMCPEVRAAYERAVIQAMHDAGIGPHDSVMLAGWSQGGILAGAMASDPTLPFTIRAITVAGAPIDHMPIPEDVSVLAFQHDADIVPRLDGAPPQQGQHWATVTTPAAPGGDVHNANTYADTAKDPSVYAADVPAVTTVVEDQAMFFSDYEIANRYEFQEQDTSVI